MDATAGHIEVIVGPMFSGKTTELIRRVKRYRHANKRCLAIKYKADIRYSEKAIATHDKTEEEATPMSTLDLDAIELLGDHDVYAIDEGQFFSNISAVAEELANRGKIVIIAALDGTFQRKPFGDIHNLIPLAEKIDKLCAVCMVCKKDAAFTKRLGSGTKVEDIGGSDKYLAACRKCFYTRT